MIKLRKIAALGLAAICLIGNTCTVSAGTSSVTSYSQQGDLRSITIPLDQEVTMYGSALCADGNLAGNVSKWSGKMYGDLAITYTTGACSFGSDGELRNIMDKADFVIPGPKLVSYSKSASILKYYDWVTTTLYY